ncbi:MAG: carboxymuconolactone decarboxylase family protein [Proteobacteria bacterium]|nr:carboxymuconolactone decarboxylase family protein [Pseudomonadota bacterium]
MARFPELKPEQWDAEQKKVAANIAAGPRGSVRGPFLPLLYSPGLADPVQAAGAHLRYKSSLSNALNEFAILITARFWTAQYEWHAHRKLALEAGLDVKIADQIARGERPSGMSAELTAIYDFCAELHRDHGVSDKSFDAVVAKFGHKGAMDLIGICGYYTLISMVLNVSQIPLPAGVEPGLPPLKR